MKISDYEKVQTLQDTDAFVIDGPRGTKTILTTHLAKQIFNRIGSADLMAKATPSVLPEDTALEPSDLIAVQTGDGMRKVKFETMLNATDKLPRTSSAYFEFLDVFADIPMRKNAYRGKNLGTVISKEQANSFRTNGKGIFLGDYWTLGSHKFYVADLDYPLNYRMPSDVNSANKKHSTVILLAVYLPGKYKFHNTAVSSLTSYIQSDIRNNTLVADTIGLGSDLASSGANIVNIKSPLYIGTTQGYLMEGDTGWYASIYKELFYLPSANELIGTSSAKVTGAKTMAYPIFSSVPQISLFRHTSGFVMDEPKTAYDSYIPFVSGVNGNIWTRDIVTGSDGNTAYVITVETVDANRSQMNLHYRQGSDTNSMVVLTRIRYRESWEAT